jgi:hypothetical protein
MKKQIINETREYSKFKFSEKNRAIDNGALRKMINSLKIYGWLSAYPMHVTPQNGRLVIIDGQHRFTAAQSLNLPVLYVVSEEADDRSLGLINSAQKPWDKFDFVSSFHNQGNSHYTKLLDFSETNKLPLGVAARLLMGQHGGRTTCTKEIRDGKFKIKNIQSAENIAQIILRLKKIVKWASNSNFVSALMKASRVKGFNHEQFISRCEANPGLLVLQPTTDAFLEMIEKIYNYRTSQKNKLSIKFEAATIP